MNASRPGLGRYLDQLSRTYGSRYLHTDPIGEVRRFDDSGDREVAAFLAAGLAFGKVDTILASLRDLWSRLDHAPAAIADSWQPRDDRRLRGFHHRWVKGADVARVLAALGRARKRHHSLGEMFLSGYTPEDSDLRPSLTRFVDGLRGQLRFPASGKPIPPARASYGVRYLLSDPRRGGAMKRMNLFLRWMVREDDGVDLGLWTAVRTDQLVMPLDTHVSRISRYLGLSRRRTVDWKMAVEITDNLKRIDSRDPVRYDFAISRLGILDTCPRKVDPVCCRSCSLVSVCTLGSTHD